MIAFAPIAVITWDVDAAAIPYIAASACSSLGYFAFLAAGYRLSEVSLVYPVARGARRSSCSPVPSSSSTTGRPPASRRRDRRRTGIVLVRGVGAMARRADANGFLLALAAGTFIAGYTLVDKQGLHHAAPIPYIELVLIGPAVSLLARDPARPRFGAFRREATWGIGLVASYSSAPTSSSSSHSARPARAFAARQRLSSSPAVIAHEHVARTRFAGAVLVAAGIALVALTS